MRPLLSIVALMIAYPGALLSLEPPSESMLAAEPNINYHTRYYQVFKHHEFNSVNKSTSLTYGLPGLLTQPKGGGLPAYYYKKNLVAADLNNLVEGSSNLVLLPPGLRNLSDQPFSVSETVADQFSNYPDQSLAVGFRSGTYGRRDGEVYLHNNLPGYDLDVLATVETADGHVNNTDYDNRYLWAEINGTRFRNLTGWTHSDNGYFEFRVLGFKSRTKSKLIYNSFNYFYDLPRQIKGSFIVDLKQMETLSDRLRLNDGLMARSIERDETYNARNTFYRSFDKHSHALETGYDYSELNYTGYQSYLDHRYFANLKSRFEFIPGLVLSTNVGYKKQSALPSARPYKCELLLWGLGVMVSRNTVDIPMSYRYFSTTRYEPNPDLVNESYSSKAVVLRRRLGIFDLDLEYGKMERRDPVKFVLSMPQMKFKATNQRDWTSDYFTGSLSFTANGITSTAKMNYLQTLDENRQEVRDDVKLNFDYSLEHQYTLRGVKNRMNVSLNWVDYNSTPDKQPIHKNLVYNAGNTTYFKNSSLTVEGLNLSDEPRQVWFYFPQPGRQANVKFTVYF